MPTQPIFLFSLPRSGSTLLQRILFSHDDISTESELWFLLPHVIALTGKYTFSQYSTASLNVATKGLLAQLPNGEIDYYDAIRALSDSIYNKLAKNNEKYLLDKTPRYYLIINEIAKIYPDAKFIFLFRNPLSIAASLVESFNCGKLGDHRHKIDFYQGPKLLAEGYKNIRGCSCAVNYESLVKAPEATLRTVCTYLDIPFQNKILTKFPDVPVGNLGDQIGSNKYSGMQVHRVENWKRVFSTSYRKKYLLKYLNDLGKDVIETFGYDYDRLKSDIYDCDVNYSFGIRDRYDLFKCDMISMLEGVILKNKLSQYKSGKKNIFMLH